MKFEKVRILDHFWERAQNERNVQVFTFVEELLIFAFNFFESNFPAKHHLSKYKKEFSTKRFLAVTRNRYSTVESYKFV